MTRKKLLQIIDREKIKSRDPGGGAPHLRRNLRFRRAVFLGQH